MVREVESLQPQSQLQQKLLDVSNLNKSIKATLDETNPKDLIGNKKVDISQVPSSAILVEAQAFEDGDRKYGYRNWRQKKVQARVYVAAALRHIHSWLEGEEVADDSGIHHLGHARACLGILLDAQASGNLIDNRVKGPFPEVMKKLNDKKKENIN